MTDTRLQRQRMIAQLLRTEILASQEEVQERLRGLGMDVTQATVSRDLDQLGAVKVRRNGRTAYAMPDAVGAAAPARERQQAIFREWVRSVETVGNLIVVKTPPGSAHLVGVAIDDSGWPEIAGTICGDDTLFIAIRDVSAAPRLQAWLNGQDLPPA